MNRRTAIWALLAGGLLGPAAATVQPAPSALPTSNSALSTRNSAPEEAKDADRIDDIELLELKVPTVVTAARREQKITAVPYAVSVITAEDIRRAGARSIPDALRLAPGVDVAELSYGNYAVSPRGLHGFLSRDVLVLVNGRQIFDSAFGGTLWGSWPFQLEDIERIEVIRGPGGVTWGANAVNGVINIITKDPADQVGLTATAGGGTRGANKEHLGYAFADGKLRMRVSGEYEGSDGHNKGGTPLWRPDDQYSAGRMALHAIYEAGANDTLILSAGNSVLNDGFPPTPLASLRTIDPGSVASFVLGAWTHRIAQDNSFDLTLYANDFQASPGVPAIDYRYQQIAMQVGHTFKPADAHTVRWGVDTRADMLDATNCDPFFLTKDYVSTGIVGVYAQDEWQFAPRWMLSLGGRVDYEFYTGFQPSARASLSYEVSRNSMIYGAVSRAFQVPPAAERFLNTPMLGGLGFLTANKDLLPETLVAYELGYRSRFLDRLDVNVDLFWNEYDALGILNPLPGPPGLFRYNLDNGYDASVYGVELGGRYEVTRKLTLLGNYTYELMHSRGPASILTTDYLSPPKHKFMVGARYSLTDDLRLNGHLYYVDAVTAPNSSNPFVRRQIHPYFRLDLNAEYEFWKDRASIAVGVRNLLDPEHYEGGTLFLNDTEVPRMVYAELRMTLK